MAMDRVLLMLESTQNLQILRKLLARKYEVLLYQSDRSIIEKFDVCITDGFTLKKNQPQVQKLRGDLEPVFLPFVLLTPRQKVSLLSDDLRNTVDEVIITPIEKMELVVRLESLLRSRQLSLQLEANNQKLTKLYGMKNRFISIAAHDLRNPLNVISGSIQILQTYNDKLPAEKKEELLDRMKISIKNINNLLEDTLLITKAEEGKLELNISPINLEKFCQILVYEFELSNSDRQINFINATIVEGIDGAKVVPMDEKILRHILGNLLSNALKYSDRETVVKFELIYDKDRVSFIIEDTGIGIPPEKLSQLFEPFHRASNVGGVSGSGLGLSIVKQCVDLYGGTIEVKSEVGVGTTFIVSLPIIFKNTVSC